MKKRVLVILCLIVVLATGIYFVGNIGTERIEAEIFNNDGQLEYQKVSLSSDEAKVYIVDN